MELYNRRVRACPITGTVPQTIVASDFRNTYCIMGMISIDPRRSTPMVYTIGEDNHDSFAFRDFVESAILNGWLRPYDILVCDNAAIHEKGFNTDLSDFLWNEPGLDGRPLRILLLPLPARSPELNPIELIWNALGKRLRTIERPRTEVNHAIARYASYFLNNIERDLVVDTYRHCKYVNTIICN